MIIIQSKADEPANQRVNKRLNKKARHGYRALLDDWALTGARSTCCVIQVLAIEARFAMNLINDFLSLRRT